MATELLQQSERCAIIGLVAQAEILLTQVWTMAEVCDPELANSAAWEIGWLHVQRGDYKTAIEWFPRVLAPPSRPSSLWPAARQALVQLCLSQAAHSGALSPPSPAQQPAPPALPPLKVTNLGCFQIVRSHETLPACTSRKAITLWRYLLTRHRRAASAQELMELLWPEAQPAQARHSLHVAVSAVRRYLDPPAGSYLLYENGLYTINPAAQIYDDCHQFQTIAAEADRYWRTGDLPRAQTMYVEALAYYHDDYSLDICDDLWALAFRERLLASFLLMLDRLGQIYFVQRRFDLAAECYQRLLERDNYREDAHCQLMRCYLELGRRGAALRQYEICAGALASDLGLEPMQETQALYRLISQSR
jgi:DNA-binding SARP family transcriptional activator